MIIPAARRPGLSGPGLRRRTRDGHRRARLKPGDDRSPGPVYCRATERYCVLDAAPKEGIETDTERAIAMQQICETIVARPGPGTDGRSVCTVCEWDPRQRAKKRRPNLSMDTGLPFVTPGTPRAIRTEGR